MALNGDVIVVGGGVTGLVAAHALRQRGYDPIVIDAPSPGGLVRSSDTAGFTLELGANTLVYTEPMAALVRELGLESAVRFPALDPYRQYVGAAGRIYEVPRSPPKFLLSPLFSAGEKVRIVRGLQRTLTPTELSEDSTVTDFFARLLGPAPGQKVIVPVLRGIFGGNADELLASTVFPKLFNHLRDGGTLFAYGQAQRVLKRKIFCLAGGNEQLCTRLSGQLGERIRRGRAEAIRPLNGGFGVDLENGETLHAPKVVVAVAGRVVAGLCRDLDPELSRIGERLRYAPIVAVHVAVPRNATLPAEGFGVLFDPTAKSALLGIMFNSLVFPHVAPPDAHLLTVCFGGVGNDAFLDHSDAATASAALSAVQSTLGVTPTRVLSTQRWPNAIPQYDATHRQLLEAYTAAMRRFPGLYFAGADIGGVGVPNRIERALAVAGEIAPHPHTAVTTLQPTG